MATMTSRQRLALGQATAYPARYDPGLLLPIDRRTQREAIGVRAALPFSGADLWTAYEISWLDARGKPCVAIGTFRVPCDSPALVESKSVKLYLGSFAQEAVHTCDEVARRIQDDLSRACGARVAVALVPAEQSAAGLHAELPGECIDPLAVATDVYQPDPTILTREDPIAEETLRSALFRSCCPVTGQPDFADVMIRYRGPRIDRAGLLRYLVSYRGHAAFHESCVERIFVDLRERCAPEALTVYARFLRRGGIDINPFRSDFELEPPSLARTARQ